MSQYDTDGNLARNMRSYSAYRLPTPQEMPERRFAEEEAKRIKRRRQMQQEAEIRNTYRALSHERVRTCIAIITVVAMMTVMVSFIVTRYARITEMSFLNAGMKQRIEQMEMSNNALNNKLSEQYNFENIKEIAQSDLGLQLAANSQILYVNGHNSDKTTINNSAAAADSSLAAGRLFSYQENVGTIEDYVESLRP
ncbi:MAG: hypothetical protein GXY99_08435 [Clostridiaceae bacterium]|jgi:cell division protein FtsL|nr:hypothetical protein [Clostridiaceae bacterium]HZJ90510.1 hypothetical protein [Oscillospiraceae bacterium]